MSNLSSNPPTCPCGYDLSGLPGPPWSCPECALITRVWPPPDPSPKLTRSEKLERLLWFVPSLLCPIVAGWVNEAVRFALLAMSALAIMGLAATLARRPAADHQSRDTFDRLPEFLGFVVAGALVALALFGISVFAHMIDEGRNC